VTIQAQILDLLRRLQQELGTAIILITHDLGVIADLVDTVVVMYAGKVAERASVKRLFAAPRHPYTQGLLRSVPSLETREHRMRTIDGAGHRPHHRPDAVPSALRDCSRYLPLESHRW
jgi:oligopeptide/dipeptide ABC transporter ATP-binding protein